jgi:hypothetical protein
MKVPSILDDTTRKVNTKVHGCDLVAMSWSVTQLNSLTGFLPKEKNLADMIVMSVVVGVLTQPEK